MIYILENEQLKVKVSSMGAELQSIRRPDDNTEYLWQGDPTYWAGRATNLFPLCGRLVEGKYIYGGNTYEMCIHGFAKLQEWTILRQTTTALTFQLRDNEETYKMFPFHFTLELTYTLDGDTLSVTWIVRNTDDKTMYFAIGGHPGFNLPLEDGKTFEDYFIEFDEECPAKRLCLSDACFYLNDAEPYPLENGKTIRLRHDLFDQDAIFLQDTCRALTLRCEGGKHAVHMTYPDMKFIGLWHKPHTEAPYVCIEPWRGVPAMDGAINHWEEMPEKEVLQPDEVYRNTYTISFT